MKKVSQRRPRNRAVGNNSFRLVLESENVGAWMAINNAFTYEWGDAAAKGIPGSRYWNGVLIQLGKFRNIENDELIEGFKTIEFLRGDKQVGFLTPADFEGGNILWINIVKKGSSQGEPVPLGAFKERLKLGQIKTPESFARAHPLHHYLQPYPGGITLWHDKGYKIEAEIRQAKKGDMTHVRHTFTLKDVDIEILRLERTPRSEPRWKELRRLRKTASNRSGWEPWPDHVENLTQQQRTRLRVKEHVSPPWKSVDRIVVTDPLVGGGNIGKNPPQSP